MKMPPWLLGAALLFWGWQSGFLLVSVPLAAALEGARFVPVRWDLAEKDFRRIWDFCSLLFVAAALYAFTANEGPAAVAGFFRSPNPAAQREAVQQAGSAALVLFRWLPLVFFVLIAAQAYGGQDRIPLRVFSWWVRRHAAGSAVGRGFNTAWPYLGGCLLGASITPKPGPWFYVGSCGLLGWALWAGRPRRFGAPVWVTLMVVAAGLGFLVQIGFMYGTRWLNIQSARWLSQFMISDTEARETRTAMGEVGRVQLSGRILMRLEAPAGQEPPTLLRESSYRFFKFPSWVGAGKGADFDYLVPETNLTTWVLAPGTTPPQSVSIAQYLTGRGEEARRGLLALPQGIQRLEQLAAFVLSTNTLGVVRVDEGPGLVIYDAWFAPGSTIDAEPDERDLVLPSNEKEMLAQVAGQLQLEGRPVRRVREKLAAWFAAKFHYSTWLPGAHRDRTNLTALGNFLLHDRAGHCEYFATAATLLLRQAGVPARYAVGYGVHERKGEQYVVRQRHAHAWCLVWEDGQWRDFDVTPPSWIEIEAHRASWFEAVTDTWSRLWFEFSKWRWGQTAWRAYLLWILVPLLALLLGRLLFRKQWKRLRQDGAGATTTAGWPGARSEFYRVAEMLAGWGLARQPGETWLGWLNRIQRDGRVGPWRDRMRVLVQLHYRYRFDPRGLEPAARDELRNGAEGCIRGLKGELKIEN